MKYSFLLFPHVKNNQLIKDVSGTPGYLSPEIILQNNQTFSSDYFSLGVVIYELIFLQASLIAIISA